MHGPWGVCTYYVVGVEYGWGVGLVTTISCRLGQSNGSLTCPIAGGVTAGVHNEGVDIFMPLRWMTKMTRMTRNLKSRPWEWLAEVYGNIVIVVILVMEGVSKAALCPSTMHHSHPLYDSRRVTDRRWLCTTSHGYTCSARQPVWVLQRLCVLALLVQGK